jgi:hypothetical protein
MNNKNRARRRVLDFFMMTLVVLAGIYAGHASASCYISIPNYCFYDSQFTDYSGYDYWSQAAQTNVGICLDRANQFNAYCGLGGRPQVNQTYPFVPVTATFINDYISFLSYSWNSMMGPVPAALFNSPIQ